MRVGHGQETSTGVVSDTPRWILGKLCLVCHERQLNGSPSICHRSERFACPAVRIRWGPVETCSVARRRCWQRRSPTHHRFLRSTTRTTTTTTCGNYHRSHQKPHDCTDTFPSHGPGSQIGSGWSSSSCYFVLSFDLMVPWRFARLSLVGAGGFFICVYASFVCVLRVCISAVFVFATHT